MPTLTWRDIARIDLEGRFQALKAGVLEEMNDDAPDFAPLIIQLDSLVVDAERAVVANVAKRARKFVTILRIIGLRDKMSVLKTRFSKAAAGTDALKTAKKIADGGAKKLTVFAVDDGLAKLFEALGEFKRGLDALDKVGVKSGALDDAREDLKTALDAAKKAAKKEDAEKKKDKGAKPKK